MEEIWKDIVGLEGRYKVSNLGRLRSLDVEIEIKKLLKNKSRKRKKPYLIDIAENYGINRKTIEAIYKNRTWRQI